MRGTTYVSAYVDTHVYVRVYNLDGGFGIEHEGHEAAIHGARLAQQRPPQQQLLRDGCFRGLGSKVVVFVCRVQGLGFRV